MGYSVGYDHTHQRDVGYGVPAICEHPDCNEEIDRGMGHACGGGFPDDGCGRYLCAKHGGGCCECDACADEQEPYPLKPDHPDWIKHKLTDESWAEWRAQNPAWVAAQLEAKP